MHKLNLSSLCFLCALSWLTLPAAAQVKLAWNNRVEAPADYNAVVFRGESVVLEAALTQYGIALPIDGTATLYYAVSGSTNYTASAASISGNKLIALWTPALDSGAARYTFFLSADTSGGRIYRANGSITIQASPGAYPPIITQTGPTLVSMQTSVDAAGTTNAMQGLSIAALQTGQASLTGQVNAALAMSYAAGDQATVARATANAAALTAGLARTTGNYLAATQAVHTATLFGLSVASTGTYVIATGALARANEALARPVGTDTGVVHRLIGGVLATNRPTAIYNTALTNLSFTGTTLNFSGSINNATNLYRVIVDGSNVFRRVSFEIADDITYVSESGVANLYGTIAAFYYEVPSFPPPAGSFPLGFADILSGTGQFQFYTDFGESVRVCPVTAELEQEFETHVTSYNLENLQIKGTASTLLINGNLFEQFWDTNANTTAWRQL